MRFNDATMKLMENIRYCLDVERFPELKPFEERIAAFDMDEIEDKTSYSLDTPDDPASPLVFGSGLGVHVFSKRAQEAVGPMVQGYLTLIHEIRSDKKLMEKEVHLNQYLGYMEEMIGRALSDRVDAFDPYQSELCSVDSVLASKITVIPHTGEASPEAKAVFTHLDNAAKLYRFKADARDGLVPEITSDTEYIEQTWKKTDACKQSAAGLADLTDQQISSFGEEYCRIKRGKWNRFAQDGITTSLRDGIRKKHGIPGALRQIEQEQRMMYHGVLPETTSIIREIAFQLKGPFGEIASAGYTPEQVQGDRGEILGIYKQLMDSCNSAITTDGITGGFNTVEEEERFLLSVQASIMEAEHRLATASKIDISHMTEEEVDIMQVGTTRANNMCDQLARPQGVKNRLASELDPRTLSGPGETRTELHARLEPLQEMMKKTGKGWFGHMRNSTGYEGMMQSLGTVMELFDKESLSRTEKLTLKREIEKLEQQCEDYLKDKAKGPSSDQGKDRYAGALGVLNALNPEKAQKHLKAAQEARKDPDLTIESIVSRAEPFQKQLTPSDRVLEPLKQCVGKGRWQQYLGELGEMSTITGIDMKKRTTPATQFYFYLLAKTDLTADQVLDIGRQDKTKIAKYMDDFVEATMSLRDKSEAEKAAWFGGIHAAAYKKIGEFSWPDKDLPVGKDMGDVGRKLRTLGNLCIDGTQDFNIYTSQSGAKKQFAPQFYAGAGGHEEWCRTVGKVAYKGQYIGQIAEAMAYGSPGGTNPEDYPVGKADLHHLLERLWNMIRGKTINDMPMNSYQLTPLSNLGQMAPNAHADDPEAVAQAEEYLEKGGTLPWAAETDARIDTLIEASSDAVKTGDVSHRKNEDLARIDFSEYAKIAGAEAIAGAADMHALEPEKLDKMCLAYLNTFGSVFSDDAIMALMTEMGKSPFDAIMIDGHSANELFGAKYAALSPSEREQAIMAEIMHAAVDPEKKVTVAEVYVDQNGKAAWKTDTEPVNKAKPKQAAAIPGLPPLPSPAAASVTGIPPLPPIPAAEESIAAEAGPAAAGPAATGPAATGPAAASKPAAEAPKPAAEAPKAEAAGAAAAEPAPEPRPFAPRKPELNPEKPDANAADLAELREHVKTHPYNLVSATPEERAQKIQLWEEKRKQLKEDVRRYEEEARSLEESMKQPGVHIEDKARLDQVRAFLEPEKALLQTYTGYIQIAEGIGVPARALNDMTQLDPAPKLRPQVIDKILDTGKRETLIRGVVHEVYEHAMEERTQNGQPRIEAKDFFDDPDPRDFDKMCIIPDEITDEAAQKEYVLHWLETYMDRPDGKKKCLDEYFDRVEQLSFKKLDLSCVSRTGDPEKNAEGLTKSERDLLDAFEIMRQEQAMGHRSYDKEPEYGRQRYGSVPAQQVNIAVLDRNANVFSDYMQVILGQNGLNYNTLTREDANRLAKPAVGFHMDAGQQVFDRNITSLSGGKTAPEHRSRLLYPSQAFPVGLEGEKTIQQYEAETKQARIEERDTLITMLKNYDKGVMPDDAGMFTLREYFNANVRHAMKYNTTEMQGYLSENGMEEVDLLFVDGKPLREYVGTKYGDLGKASGAERNKIINAMYGEFMLANLSGQHRTEMIESRVNEKGEKVMGVVACRIDAHELDAIEKKTEHGGLRNAFDFGATKIDTRAVKQDKLWAKDSGREERQKGILEQFEIQRQVSREAKQFLAQITGTAPESLEGQEGFDRALDSVYINGLAAREFFGEAAPSLKGRPDEVHLYGNLLRQLVDAGLKDPDAPYHVAVEDQNGMLHTVPAVAAPGDKKAAANAAQYNSHADDMHAELNRLRTEALDSVKKNAGDDPLVGAVKAAEGSRADRKLVGLNGLMKAAGMNPQASEQAPKRAAKQAPAAAQKPAEAEAKPEAKPAEAAPASKPVHSR